MATTIVNPFAGDTDPIDSNFNKIFQQIGPVAAKGGATGGGTGPSGVQPQPVEGDSLTQFFRSLSNYLGTKAPELVETGMGYAGEGVDFSKEGMGTTRTGLETLEGPLGFWNKIMSGDPNATAAALAPTAANINTIMTGATDQASRGMPAGGYRAATLAGLPFAQAAQVGNAALGLQPAAAEAIAGLGKTQAGIGGMQADIGQGIARTGTELTGQGMQGLDAAIQNALRKMGVNIEGGFANQFQKIAQGLAALI